MAKEQGYLIYEEASKTTKDAIVYVAYDMNDYPVAVGNSVSECECLLKQKKGCRTFVKKIEL